MEEWEELGNKLIGAKEAEEKLSERRRAKYLSNIKSVCKLAGKERLSDILTAERDGRADQPIWREDGCLKLQKRSTVSS